MAEREIPRRATGAGSAKKATTRGDRSAPRAVLVLAAYPRRTDAERAARSLVRKRLLACATVTREGRAFYTWEGELKAESSVLLTGKTLAARARAAVEAIQASHPDQVPEILILPILGGHVPYLAWLAREVRRR